MEAPTTYFTLGQSLPLCAALAAFGGILEVGATAVTAVPAVRDVQGRTLKPFLYWLALAGNLGLQAIGSLFSHLVATWFGPVSVVVPIYYAATLLSNMFIFGIVLGTEFFSKTMRVGTYVIAVAVTLLPILGPQCQENQDITELFHHWYTIAWFTLLLCGTTVSGVLLVRGGIDEYSINKRYLLLLTARSCAISANLTVSRSFILSPTKLMFITFLVLKVFSGAVYTYAIVVQAAVVDQARFVPLNTTIIILVNAATGCLIWEDWRVIQSWFGYACVFVLLGLGCDLLLTVPLFNSDNPMFGANHRASLLIHPKQTYQAIIEEHPSWELDYNSDDGELGVSDRPSHTIHARTRKEAWKQVMLSPRERTSTF